MNTRLLCFVAVLAACGSVQSRADFGVGTERITQVGNRMISWGFQTGRYEEGKSTPVYQPTSEIVYAGVQGSSIVLNHLQYRSVVTDGWGSTSWILAGSQTTYHPASGKTLTVAGITMDIKRADGDSIRFVVKNIGTGSSTTISGPPETVAGPDTTKTGETGNTTARYSSGK